MAYLLVNLSTCYPVNPKFRQRVIKYILLDKQGAISPFFDECRSHSGCKFTKFQLDASNNLYN